MRIKREASASLFIWQRSHCALMHCPCAETGVTLSPGAWQRQVPMVKLSDTADLNPPLPAKGMPVRSRLGAPPLLFNHVTLQRPFEIHVHGQVPLRADAGYEQLQEALKPLWTCAGARSLADGAASVRGKSQVSSSMPRVTCCSCAGRYVGMRIFVSHWMKCMSLNDLVEQGAAVKPLL